MTAKSSATDGDPGTRPDPAPEPIDDGAHPGAAEEALVTMEADHRRLRLERARTVVHRNVLWALGMGALPIPIFDILALTGVQLKMIRELSALYDVTFSESLVRKLLGSLLAGFGAASVGTALALSLFKLFPPVSAALSVLSMPATAGAVTHATGRIFTMHFESGGTFFDLDPNTLRAHFKAEVERSRAAVARLQAEARPGAPRTGAAS